MNSTFAGKTLHDIVDTYSDTLIRIAYQNTKNMSDAEDIVQEVYIKLMKCHKSFKSMEHLKAWLIRVTINRCKDHFKSAWFRKTTELKEDAVLIHQESEPVMEEIFMLERMDRNIVYLYYYEGYTIKEIAQILKMKENTVSSKLQRARKKLKIILQEGCV